MTQPNGWNYDIHTARNELWTVGVGPNHDTTNMPRQSYRVRSDPHASASNPSWTPAHYDFSAFHVARLIKSCFSSHTQRRSQVAALSMLSLCLYADPHPLAGRFSPVWNPNKARENASRCSDCRGSATLLPETRCWALKLTLAACCWLAADKFRLPSTGNQWECYVNSPHPSIHPSIRPSLVCIHSLKTHPAPR